MAMWKESMGKKTAWKMSKWMTCCVVLVGLVGFELVQRGQASSHREAPLISQDPTADNTDVYAFVSPDRPDTVTILANYIPLEQPAGPAHQVLVPERHRVEGAGVDRGESGDGSQGALQGFQGQARRRSVARDSGRRTTLEQMEVDRAGARLAVDAQAERGDFFGKWGDSDVLEADRLVNICLEHGLNFFDTADVYSKGASEEILGAALKGRRDKALISTKATFSMGDGPNDKGSSRWHLIRAAEASLRRLNTDHIDVYFMHGYDALTPVEEMLSALDHLISSGKVRYIGASNYSGWHLMKALATSEKYGLARFVAYQGYYSLVGRDYEWELMPLALDQGVGTMVWSPLGWGRLTGKIRRGQPAREGRIAQGGETGGPRVDDDLLYNIVDALDTYLSPDTWEWGGTVYRNELIALIDQVAGVDRVVSLTTPATDLALTGVAPLADTDVATSDITAT